MLTASVGDVAYVTLFFFTRKCIFVIPSSVYLTAYTNMWELALNSDLPLLLNKWKFVSWRTKINTEIDKSDHWRWSRISVFCLCMLESHSETAHVIEMLISSFDLGVSWIIRTINDIIILEDHSEVGQALYSACAEWWVLRWLQKASLGQECSSTKNVHFGWKMPEKRIKQCISKERL